MIREVQKDYKHIDIPIHKGTLVSVSFFAKQYNPEYFENPKEYIPERWEK